MGSFLASEGGYQDFDLGGTEWALLSGSAVIALLALVAGAIMMKGVLASEDGTDEMNTIAGAIQEGAMAYIKRQFRTIGLIVVPLAIVVFVTSREVLDESGDNGLSTVLSGFSRTGAFLVGAVLSGFIGFLGMWLSTRANVRTAQAARTGSMNSAMQVAFRAGGTVGLFTAGLGLIGAVAIVMIFQNTASAILVGFGFGGSLLALFLRVGGGIFTKAADVGADLVGKVEAGIPEDDPRNPATIADNVGDNVGDCAGMAADLFESFGVTLVASIILGVSAFTSAGLSGEGAAQGMIVPIAVVAIGLVASMIAIYSVKAKASDTDALAPINRGLMLASLVSLAGAAVICFGYVGINPDGEGIQISYLGLRIFMALVAGVVLGQVASRITQYFTSSKFKPVRDIAEAGETGPATVVLSGISSGLESAVWAAVAICGAIGTAMGLADGNTQFGLYLVALTGIGMLATTAIVVAEDTFGPIADNAQGIAEMSGVFEGETEVILDGLDTVGNTTKAVTKGFAIGSAVIAAVALFASFIETIGAQTGIPASAVFDKIAINVADPKTFIGALMGGAMVFLFSSLAILAVSRTAGVVVQEVRNQFKAKPGIMEGTEKPDYGAVIDICTGAALRELTTPALLAVLMPVIIGFGLDQYALGGYLASAIIIGQLMANFLSNSGGAWDNAKKHVEEGNHGGKGSDVHTAVVIGDTVGDPFKDTAGPAINPLLKVMNLVSLLILPAVISMGDNNARYIIAGAGIVVIIGAILFSKRSAPTLVAS